MVKSAAPGPQPTTPLLRSRVGEPLLFVHPRWVPDILKPELPTCVGKPVPLSDVPWESTARQWQREPDRHTGGIFPKHTCVHRGLPWLLHPHLFFKIKKK